MDTRDEITGSQPPGRQIWFALVMNLLCFAAVPAFWYLADHSVLPWKPADTRWTRLRADPTLEARAVSAGDFVVLIRRGCFGSRPDYRVTVYASGRVEYLGMFYVCETGPRTAVVDAHVAARLIADLRDGGFFEIRWNPTDDVTDAPEVFMQLSIGGRQEWIRDYHGDLSAPEIARRYEREIDHVAGSYRWLPTREYDRDVCPDGREVRD